MTSNDLVFLLGRTGLAVLCFYAAWAAWQLSLGYRLYPPRRWRSISGGALIALIGLWHINTGVEEGVRRAGQPIRMLDWVWLAIDLLVPIFFLIIVRATRERDGLEAALATQAEHDPLTSLPNRAGFSRRALAALSDAARCGEFGVAVMLDIDYFKRINDGWGHPAGDVVLRRVATVARAGLRAQDVLGRYGGEEFALVLPGITPEHAVPLVERLREVITAGVAHPGAPGHRLTFSGGIAAIAGSDIVALEAALDAADAALYAAKQAGRDRVLVA